MAAELLQVTGCECNETIACCVLVWNVSNDPALGGAQLTRRSDNLSLVQAAVCRGIPNHI